MQIVLSKKMDMVPKNKNADGIISTICLSVKTHCHKNMFWINLYKYYQSKGILKSITLNTHALLSLSLSFWGRVSWPALAGLEGTIPCLNFPSALI
jgi:hypothetical protein